MEAIQKNCVVDEVQERIRVGIEQGTFAQGEKIPSENQLSRELGVSRATVRSAIHRLAGIGVLESRQGEGTYVCTLNGSQQMNRLVPVVTLPITDARAVLEFRQMIECEGAARAAERITKVELEELRENEKKMSAVSPLSEESSALDLAFHLGIARAAKNPLLIQTMGILQSLILESMRDIAARIREDNAGFYHRKILTTLSDKESKKAYFWMREHLEKTLENLS